MGGLSIQTREEFLGFNIKTGKRIDFQIIYVDMTDDLIAGLLLSQIVYWNSDDEQGRPRLRVEKDGEMWLAKKRTDWWDEIRISPKQYDRAVKILKDLNIVEVKIMKFNGMTTPHIKLEWNTFLKLWQDQINEEMAKKSQKTQGNPKGRTGFDERVKGDLTKGKKGNSPKGKRAFDERSKPLTEITNRKYNRDYKHSGDDASESDLSDPKNEVNAIDEEKDTPLRHHYKNNDYDIPFKEIIEYYNKKASHYQMKSGSDNHYYDPDNPPENVKRMITERWIFDDCKLKDFEMVMDYVEQIFRKGQNEEGTPWMEYYTPKTLFGPKMVHNSARKSGKCYLEEAKENASSRRDNLPQWIDEQKKSTQVKKEETEKPSLNESQNHDLKDWWHEHLRKKREQAKTGGN